MDEIIVWKMNLIFYLNVRWTVN